ncbi:MAG: SLC13 family permease [Methanomicrobiaceae archaeon]|nr:SLC13 family permease [Methanomicrobiaceae archaeon]
MDGQILLMLLVLAATVILFVTEALRIDVAAIVIMIAITWLGLVTPAQAFSGFASNAVISMLSVMILGYGIDRAGVMLRLSAWIIRTAGTTEKRLIGVTSLFVGSISGFMQNIGAAALFLPALMRISKKTGIHSSRLLMPMGYAAILGGSLTMVGTSSLIVLNDLLEQGGYEPLGLFVVTPAGIALLLTGVAYFYFLGPYVLPEKGRAMPAGVQEELIETWQLPESISYVAITETGGLNGLTREDVHLIETYGIHLVALVDGEEILYAPWRHTRFVAGQELAIMGDKEEINKFADDYGLEMVQGDPRIVKSLSGDIAGFAEVIIPPRSDIAGRTPREIALRKNYSVEPLLLLSHAERKTADFSDIPLQPGDTIVVYGLWDRIRALGDEGNFVLITRVEGEPFRESKALSALICFMGAITLTFTGVPISISFFSGAIAMVLLRVITIDEAYRSIDWRTIFFIGSLISLGIAMESSGTAAFLATMVTEVVAGQPVVVILLAFGLLTTVFSLFMTNVAATVLLVPLMLVLARELGISAQALVLLVGVCASNSFVLPTHQVNALFMAPGGYDNRDYMRAGSIMTVLFLLVAVGLIYILYL